MKKKTVGVVGGGAAGMMAAITAAGQGASVTLLERGERVGKKLLMTGNGRCNLGNLDLDGEMYYSGNKDLVQNCLARFDTEATLRFFRSLGLLVKNKNGYLYPVCEQASVVLDVLRNELKALGVEIVTGCKINQIKREQESDRITVSDGTRNFCFDSVILACGSKAVPKTGSDGSGYKLARQSGHRLVPTVPALVQLHCREDCMKAVAGVRAEGTVSVYRAGKCAAEEYGEIQFTDYGISGIPVFQISRVVNYILREQEEAEVVLNLLPDFEKTDFEQMCAGRILLQADRTVEEFFTGMLNRKLMMLFIKMAGLKPVMPVEQAQGDAIKQVYSLCRSWTLHVTGSNPYENAQVCAGGVDLLEVTENMESRREPGIYFAGEILDVDGKCGGYNLQWAWCSGYLAGMAAAGYKTAAENKNIKDRRGETQ